MSASTSNLSFKGTPGVTAESLLCDRETSTALSLPSCTHMSTEQQQPHGHTAITFILILIIILIPLSIGLL